MEHGDLTIDNDDLSNKNSDLSRIFFYLSNKIVIYPEKFVF